MSTLNEVAEAASDLLNKINGLPESAVTEVISVHHLDVRGLADDLRTLQSLGQIEPLDLKDPPETEQD